MAEPNVVVPPADAPAQNNAAADVVTRQIKMDIYAPPVFHGRSTDDALNFLQYVERYAAFKQMNETEKLQFITILLRDTASDLYEALPNTDRESWDWFKPAFLSRFGRSDTVCWRNTSDLYTMSQLIDEPAEDFIARVMKKAKYVPNIDESLLALQSFRVCARRSAHTCCRQTSTTRLTYSKQPVSPMSLPPPATRHSNNCLPKSV